MKEDQGSQQFTSPYEEPVERMDYDFGLKRRSFMQILGAGLLVAVSASPTLAQRNGRNDRSRPRKVNTRIHLAKDGAITVLAGKVEGGQGSRAELTQAAAEELRVAPSAIGLILADTSVVPDDGMTAGSRSTPSTVPAVRQGAAAAREILIDFAAKTWSVERSTVEVKDGKATHGLSKRTLTYADLASSEEAAKLLEQPIASDIA